MKNEIKIQNTFKMFEFVQQHNRPSRVFEWYSATQINDKKKISCYFTLRFESYVHAEWAETLKNTSS